MTATIDAPADLRACAQCAEVKPLAEYRIRKNRHGRYHRRTCLTCDYAYEHEANSWRARAAEKRAVSGEIAALIRATTVRSEAPSAPLPTREEMADWYYGGCRI